VRPKPRPILAHSPTVCLESSLPSRNHQRTLGQPCLSIGRGVEHGEMLPNDLLRLIALDPLCSRIPVGDNAFCIQHINGVVRHAPDKKPEPALTLTEPCRGLG